MEPLKIAFLWHHHQPYYKDPENGRYELPWVRLHAVKAYFDMAAILEEFPDIRACFNLVPSLVRQILDYQEGGAKDLFLDLSLKPARDLEPDERRFLLKYFFMAHRETMIRPLPRYEELRIRRGESTGDEALNEAAASFGPEDFQDLQVLFNLSWFGFKAVEIYPDLKHLRNKGKGFSEEDKATVLDRQMEVLRRVLPLYRHLEATGQAELTMSPFYHPILPLLYDTDIARRCMPASTLPDRFQAPEDARAQIQRAAAFHTEVFGRRPTGCWPSEGSVCPEVVPLLAEADLRWIATDEEILFHSIPTASRRADLYRVYQTGGDGKSIGVVFRDKELSNLISFTLGGMEAPAAVDLFFRHLKEIREAVSSGSEPALVTVVLDGENPWENYRDGGRPFLWELYRRLSQSDLYRTVRISDELERNPPQRWVNPLYSGSWINHDFDIWIGSDEENRAWNYLNRTRRTILPRLSDASISAEARERALEAIFAAEGSDWFWWYGDDFASLQEEEFDRLFRGHLAAAFRALGLDPPDFLARSILQIHPAKHVHPPTALIHPTLDGRRTDYFEWHGAGYYDAGRRSARFGPDPLVAAIGFGFDLDRLYLRVDPPKGAACFNRPGFGVHFHFFGGREEFRFTVPCLPGGVCPFRLEKSPDGIHFEAVDSLQSAVMDAILELSVPFALLGWKAEDRHFLMIEIRENGKILGVYPPNGYLVLQVPGPDFEDRCWFV